MVSGRCGPVLAKCVCRLNLRWALRWWYLIHLWFPCERRGHYHRILIQWRGLWWWLLIFQLSSIRLLRAWLLRSDLSILRGWCLSYNLCWSSRDWRRPSKAIRLKGSWPLVSLNLRSIRGRLVLQGTRLRLGFCLRC